MRDAGPEARAGESASDGIGREGVLAGFLDEVIRGQEAKDATWSASD